MDSEQVQTERVRFGGQGLAKPFRRFALVWLSQDWDDAAVRAAADRQANRRAKGESPGSPDKLLAAVEDTYDAALEREDIEKRGGQLRHYARLHLKASLTAVDRFFMQVRRALTVAERGVVSASADRRMWYGKNAYNPAVLVKLVEIFRTYFNYCEVGEDRRTPAMRLGLAKCSISPEDLIYYRPPLPERRRAPAKPPEPKLLPPGIWPADIFDGRNEKPLHVLRREGLEGLEPLP
jgi:hypothetical protein